MENVSKTCEYEYEYGDTRTGEHQDYFCNRSRILSSNFCKFHDKHYFQTHKKDVRELFLKELKEEQDQSKPIFFIGCNVPSVEVNSINQNRSVYFINAKFHGGVKFFDIQFKTVDFTNATFCGDFHVMNVDTSEKFRFVSVKFNNPKNSKVEFRMCNLETSDFSLTTFYTLLFLYCKFNHSKFRMCTFRDKLSIDDCTFTGKTNFSDCEFLGESIFSLSSFHANTTFQYTNFIHPTRFHHVDFEKQQLVIFTEDLSKVSFIGTDITRIKFDGNTIWGEPDKYVIFDASKLINNVEESDLSAVLAVYRNLRENYEFQLMYEEAGQFFVKEMELKRIYFQDANDKNRTKIKKWRRYFSLANCYNILSNYGESFKRVSVFSFALFSSALAYFFIHPDINTINQIKPLGDIDYAMYLWNNPLYRLEISLERTFGSFLQINNVRLADYIVRIASLPILGAMFIVLRRRFERRFRH